MTKEELEKEARTECFMLTVNTIGIDQRDVELAYVMGAEPREKRIEELIALINAERERQEKCDDVHLRTIADLEKENAELKQADEGKVVEHFEAYGQCRDSRRIAELEAENERLTVSYETLKLHDEEEIGMLKSENSELKDDNKVMADNYSKMEQKFYDNLTKAKEIIKDFILVAKVEHLKDRYETVDEAEQFLSEVEK